MTKPTGLAEPLAAKPLKHWFVSNRAFTQMTGIRRVCGACGAADPPRNSVCPGKRKGAPQ